MRARSIIVVVLVTMVSLVVNAPAAVAASTVDTGWWTAAPIAAAPDASEGLLVQGGSSAEDPFAYAAVGFVLAEGETPVSLTLTIAEGSASTPNANLALCPLTESFSPAEGGSMEEAPEFDCATKVTAEPSDDGSSYKFDDLSGLVQTGSLAVAILPTAPTDRVVVARPGPDALESDMAATTAGGSDSTFDSGSDSSTFGSTSGTSTGSFDVPAPPSPTVSAPQPADNAGGDSARSNGESVAAPAAANTIGSSSDDSRLPAMIFVGLILLAAALWLSIGRTTQEEPISTD